MRRLLPIVIACLLAAALARPVAAAGSLLEYAPFSVGASLTPPSSTWTTPADCLAGYANTTEFRCAWEFSLSGIPSGQIITSATLKVTRTANCPANNCPVLLNWYTGNGAAEATDVVASSTAAFSWTPSDNSPHSFNVLDQIRGHYAAAHDWAGFNLRATGNYGAYQYFDPKTISLEVSYGNAVTVLIEPFFNGGSGMVTSSPSGISCPDACGRNFADGTKLTLTAAPDPGSAFSEWRTGPCAHSTKLTCSFDVPLSDVTVAVTFVATPSPTPTPAPTQNASPHPTATATAGGSPGPSKAPTAAPTSASATAAASSDGAATASVIETGSAATAGATTSVSETGSATAGATTGATAAPGPVVGSSAGGVPFPVLLLLLLLVIIVGGGGFWLGTRRNKPSA